MDDDMDVGVQGTNDSLNESSLNSLRDFRRDGFDQEKEPLGKCQYSKIDSSKFFF